MKRSAASTLLFLLLVCPLAAQTQSALRFQSVQVPVTVLDESGNPVRGLTAGSFDVLEDGKRQVVTRLRVVDFAKEPAAALTPLPADARRSYLLLFDLGASPASRERAREAARRFVKDVALPRDLVAAGTIESGSFRLLCAFTTDRELVGSAIDDPRGFHGSDPLQIANQTVIWQGSGSPAEAPPATPPAPAPPDQVSLGRIEQSISAIGQLASALRRVPGRKQILVLTEDWDTSAAPKRDVIDSAARNCRNADVVVHTVNTGTKAGGGLAAIAASCGGEAFRNADDLAASFARVLRRQEVVYVVSFDSVLTDTPGKFHELSVRVPNVPHTVVTHRTGHYEPGSESGFERVMANAEVVVNDIGSEDLHIAALAAPFPTSGVIAQVPVVADISGTDFLIAAGNSGANALDIFVYAFDTSGIVRDRIFQRMSVDAAKTAETLRKGGVKYVGTLALPPGKYAIRTLVVAGDARGFARTDTEVRGPKQMSLLPPLFFDEASRWVLAKGAAHVDKAAYPFQVNGEPFVPSARAVVQNGHAQKVALFVLNAAPSDLVWQMSVVDSAGRAHTATPAATAFQGEGITKLLFDYTPTDLPTGGATANFIVQKKSSNESQKKSLPLIVIP